MIAACRTLLEERPGPFRYVDAFSGPAGSLLLPGGEWTRGVGKVERAGEPRSPDVAVWLQWYLARPRLVGLRYPGSALIASDVAARYGKRLDMALFDIAEDVVRELRSIFPKQQVIGGSVSPDHPSMQEADLLFIDPPSLEGGLRPLVFDLVGLGSAMLAWLPINASTGDGKASISDKAEEELEMIRRMPLTHASRVRWAHGGRTIGCQLAYRGSEEMTLAIRAAVDEVVGRCDWKLRLVEHYEPV